MTSVDEREALRVEAEGLEREVCRLREQLDEARRALAALDEEARGERGELERVQRKLRLHREMAEARPGLYGGRLYRLYRANRVQVWVMVVLIMATAAWFLWPYVEAR